MSRAQPDCHSSTSFVPGAARENLGPHLPLPAENLDVSTAMRSIWEAVSRSFQGGINPRFSVSHSSHLGVYAFARDRMTPDESI